MYEILLIAFLLIAIALVGLVLIQRGKGADMGASFGAGASATLFGSSGSANFLSRATAMLATAFFIISLVLGNLTAKQSGTAPTGEWDDLSVSIESQQPAVIPAAPTTANSDIPN